MPRGTQGPPGAGSGFAYGAVTLYGRAFLRAPLPTHAPDDGGPTTPGAPQRRGRARCGLLRGRSPLLAQSFLFSLPAGTEMFQFPAFAPRRDGAAAGRVPPGSPIRTSAGRRVLAPRRGFSQLAASFIASESRRHPPRALLRFPCASRLRASRPTRSILVNLLGPPGGGPQRFQHVNDLAIAVENNGFEPLTPCLQSRCSSQLS